MKRIRSLGCLVLVFLLFNACVGTPGLSSLSGKDRMSASETKEQKERTSQMTIAMTELTTFDTDEANGSGGAVILPQKYRHRFYSVYYPFVEIVGEETYDAWKESLNESSDSEIMLMLQFVQYFNITREQFDKANLETAKIIRDKLDGRPCMRPMDYTNQEDDEIYNADIIYTFDEDIINAYYLGPDYPYLFDFEFDEAVADGTYTSQTEVWVDVDEMEAEILAKYGSLD